LEGLRKSTKTVQNSRSVDQGLKMERAEQEAWAVDSNRIKLDIFTLKYESTT